MSCDSIDQSETNDFNDFEPEFLSVLKTYSFSNLSRKLKMGTTIMLRNLSEYERLCNGIRLTITKLANHVI